MRDSTFFAIIVGFTIISCFIAWKLIQLVMSWLA